MEQILIVDDSMVQSHALRLILEEKYQVEVCHSAALGLERVPELRPCLILLDVVMPGMDGFEMLGRLKANPETADIPVILITSLSDVGHEEKGLNLGAVDYITKPFQPGIVLARVRTHTQLYAYRKTIENLMRLDGLTGIPNRRCYDERSREEWFRSMRQQLPLSIGLLDIDFFKQYNDHYGHPAGDEALKTVAMTLAGCLRRAGDFTARYGGEEFVFLMPDTALEEGRLRADQARRAVEALRIPHAASFVSPHLTVSVGGITVLPRPHRDYQDVFSVVDQMLYQAKRNGRNAVVWSADPRTAGDAGAGKA